jgi:hypothetical protein
VRGRVVLYQMGVWIGHMNLETFLRVVSSKGARQKPDCREFKRELENRILNYTKLPLSLNMSNDIENVEKFPAHEGNLHVS